MTSEATVPTLAAEEGDAMGHLGAQGDIARTDESAETDRRAVLRIARETLGRDHETLTDAQKREFEAIMRLGLHCSENLIGPAIGSADIDTHLYDPLTGLPR